MRRKRAGRTRNEYMSLICEYTKRRDAKPKGSPKRLELSRQIAMMRFRMKQIRGKYKYTVVNDKYMEVPVIVHEVAKKIKAIYGIDVRGTVNERKENFGYTVYHLCFCKYLMENGCNSRQISFFIGSPSKNAASKARLRFTRTFSTNPQNKQTYHDFIRHIRPKQVSKGTPNASVHS